MANGSDPHARLLLNSRELARRLIRPCIFMERQVVLRKLGLESLVKFGRTCVRKYRSSARFGNGLGRRNWRRILNSRSGSDLARENQYDSRLYLVCIAYLFVAVAGGFLVEVTSVRFATDPAAADPLRNMALNRLIYLPNPSFSRSLSLATPAMLILNLG